MLKQVEIFTDGSCLGNPGPGGYGAILRYQQREKTFSEGYRLTTNNRMEMMAAIVALEALKEPCTVVLSTDSQYVRQGITQWIHNWKKRGWKTADKKPVKNVDLWKRLDAALDQGAIQLLRPEGLSPNLSQRPVLHPVSGGLDRHDIDIAFLKAMRQGKGGSRHPCLRHRQRRGARAETDRF